MIVPGFTSVLVTCRLQIPSGPTGLALCPCLVAVSAAPPAATR